MTDLEAGCPLRVVGAGESEFLVRVFLGFRERVGGRHDTDRTCDKEVAGMISDFAENS